MRDYAELIKALRCCNILIPCDECPYYNHGEKLSKECGTMNAAAADAIEELLAEVKHLELETAANETDKQYLAEENRKLVDSLMNLRAPHWISVEDRLPKQFICVLATDGEDVGIAACQGFIDDYPVWSNAWNLEYVEDQSDEDFLQVTHWMPLPEPPKEGAE